MQAYLFLCYDRVHYYDAAWIAYFERNSLDETLPDYLLKQVREKGLSALYIITGPGWFTNLRVGSLIANLLKQYMPDIALYTISKLDCYAYAVEKERLPAQWLLYIGQQKSVWHYDFGTKTYQMVPKDTILDTPYFTDAIADYYMPWYPDTAVSFIYTDDQLMMVYENTRYAMTPLIRWLQPVANIDPSYYVQPIIG